jgi:hypothetical protein
MTVMTVTEMVRITRRNVGEAEPGEAIARRNGGRTAKRSETFSIVVYGSS